MITNPIDDYFRSLAMTGKTVDEALEALNSPDAPLMVQAIQAFQRLPRHKQQIFLKHLRRMQGIHDKVCDKILAELAAELQAAD
jgi:hypothetical protein